MVLLSQAGLAPQSRQPILYLRLVTSLPLVLLLASLLLSQIPRLLLRIRLQLFSVR